MISYGKQFIDKEDIDGVVKVLQSDYLTQGPKVLEFEKALAKYCGAKYAVVCSNGTAALHLAYLAGEIKSGDEVITTPNTFVATSNMLLSIGAKPVFCDIRLDTYNIDEEKIEKLITKKTKAIVPVHFAGQSCEMTKIKKIAKKHKLLVIEDACHGLGGEYKKTKIGSCKFSDMALFSFHPVKSIATGEGGAILTNNKKLYERILSLRSHGVHKDKKGKNVMTELGFNYRMSDLQASLGVTQLKKLNMFIKKRRQVVEWYKKAFKGFSDVTIPIEMKNCVSSWHIYVVRVKDQSIRDDFMAYLYKNGIGVNFHYPAVYSHPYYMENGYKNVGLKNTEEYQGTCVTLPCYTLLKKGDVEYVVNQIKEYFKKI